MVGFRHRWVDEYVGTLKNVMGLKMFESRSPGDSFFKILALTLVMEMKYENVQMVFGLS